jgi:hypothetical protein
MPGKRSWIVWPPLLVATLVYISLRWIGDPKITDVDCQRVMTANPKFAEVLAGSNCSSKRIGSVYHVKFDKVLADRSVPFEAVLPLKSRSGAAVLNIVGGPADTIELSPDRHASWAIATALARNGVGLFRVAYSGTYERSYFPQADLPLALEELEQTYNLLESAGYSVCMFGESLGGYLTLMSRQESRSEAYAKSKAVLFNPLVLSGYDATNYFDKQIDANRLVYHSFRSFSFRHDHTEEFHGVREELRRDIFISFFGELLHRSPNEGDVDGVSIIYTSEEPLLGRQNYILARKGLAKNFVEIADSSHSLPEGFFKLWKRRKIVDTLLRHCEVS